MSSGEKTNSATGAPSHLSRQGRRGAGERKLQHCCGEAWTRWLDEPQGVPLLAGCGRKVRLSFTKDLEEAGGGVLAASRRLPGSLPGRRAENHPRFLSAWRGGGAACRVRLPCGIRSRFTQWGVKVKSEAH